MIDTRVQIRRTERQGQPILLVETAPLDRSSHCLYTQSADWPDAGYGLIVTHDIQLGGRSTLRVPSAPRE